MKNLIVVALVVIVVGLFVGFYIRRRQIAFEGEVIDKDIREQVNNNQDNLNNPQRNGLTVNLGSPNNSNVTHDYLIKVQTSAGKQIEWQISEGKYQIVNIGDHVTKRSGTTDIDITPRVQNGPPTPPPSVTTPPSIAN